jgi:hypothetical protein
MSFESKENNREKLLKTILELNSIIIIGLSVLEYNIRESMIQIFQSVLGPEWLEHILSERNISVFKEEASIIVRRKSNQFVLSEKKFTEEASFGFWVELLNRETYKELKGIPIRAFNYRPATVKRNKIYRIFKNLKDLRNRLVHNRLKLDASRMETALLLKTLQGADEDIRTLISYINPAALTLLPPKISEKISELEKLL